MSPIVFEAVQLFAQQSAPGAGPGAPPDQFQLMLYGYILPFGMVAVVFYFFVLGPQNKMRKEQEQMLASIKKNDRVVLECGIVGVVAGQSSDGKEIVLRTHDETRITVLRSAVRGKYGGESASESAKS